MKDHEYIKRLLKYGSKIRLYMQEIDSFEKFLLHPEKADAVILNLEQIGETARKISQDTKRMYSKINWPSIIGLANMISHEYEGIRLEIIYEIATIHINLFFQSFESITLTHM